MVRHNAFLFSFISTEWLLECDEWVTHKCHAGKSMGCLFISNNPCGASFILSVDEWVGSMPKIRHYIDGGRLALGLMMVDRATERELKCWREPIERPQEKNDWFSAICVAASVNGTFARTRPRVSPTHSTATSHRSRIQIPHQNWMGTSHGFALVTSNHNS